MDKPKNFISRIAVGKIQRKPILDVLSFDMALLNNVSTDALIQLIQNNKGFEKWVINDLRRGTLGERLSEAESSDQGRARIKHSDLRAVIFSLFSDNQRAGGSRISGYPLIEIDSQACVGLEAEYEPQKDIVFMPNEGKEDASHDDMARLSGYHIKVGRPYAKTIKQVMSLIARGVDRISANLSCEVTSQLRDKEDVSVEELSAWCSDNLGKLMAKPNSRGRLISKVDFFLYPPPAMREKILKQSSINKRQATALRVALQKGKYFLSAFDISGGAAGVGISEVVARHWGVQSSNNLATYVDSLLGEHDRRNNSTPSQIIVMPCEADLKTFGSVEFAPLCRAFRERRYPCHVVTSEAYQDQLSKSPDRVSVRNIDGDIVIVGGEERTLIVRRYTYLYEGNEQSRGAIPRHPFGTTVLPSDESRIIASDCRVNLRMLDHVTKPLRGEPGEGQRGSFQLIPFTFLKLEDANASYAAQGFLASCTDGWPEVKYLGGVVKPVDKMPVSEAGVVRSAYPLPPIPTSRHVIDIMVKPLFESLIAKGVDEIVVMPNILPLVVDQNYGVLPKFEIRMISLGA